MASLPGWKPLIVCEGTTGPGGDPCGYKELVELAQVVVHDLVIISTFLAVVVFAYAGFKLLFSGGNQSEYTKVKAMFTKVAIGYLWILAAWLVVYTISKALLNAEFILL